MCIFKYINKRPIVYSFTLLVVKHTKSTLRDIFNLIILSHKKISNSGLYTCCTKCSTLSRNDVLVSSTVNNLLDGCIFCYKISFLLIRLEGESASYYPCNKCQKWFSSEFNLVSHVEVVHEGKRYQCNECSKNLSSAFRAAEHISTVHNELNIAKDSYTIVWVPVSDEPDRTEAEKNELIEQQKKQIAALKQQLQKIQKKNEKLSKLILSRQAKSYNLRNSKQ